MTQAVFSNEFSSLIINFLPLEQKDSPCNLKMDVAKTFSFPPPSSHTRQPTDQILHSWFFFFLADRYLDHFDY